MRVVCYHMYQVFKPTILNSHSLRLMESQSKSTAKPQSLRQAPVHCDAISKLPVITSRCKSTCDKPVIESLQPNAIDQTEALENQFEGMSDTPFTYPDYEEARHKLIRQVNDSMTETDREFLLSFENGEPDWEKCCAGDLSRYPSVKWKLQNIAKLKMSNPQKHKEGVEKLSGFFISGTTVSLQLLNLYNGCLREKEGKEAEGG